MSHTFNGLKPLWNQPFFFGGPALDSDPKRIEKWSSPENAKGVIKEHFHVGITITASWWYTYPSEKYDFVSCDYEIPNWMESH